MHAPLPSPFGPEGAFNAAGSVARDHHTPLAAADGVAVAAEYAAPPADHAAGRAADSSADQPADGSTGPSAAPSAAYSTAHSTAHSVAQPVAQPANQPADTRIGQLLLQAGKLTADNVERVARTQNELGLRFGEAALRLGLVNQEDVDAAIARQFAYPLAARGDSALSDRLVVAYHPAGVQGDTLRAIRSQLLLRWFGTGQHALAISGVGQGDASSVLAANLALVFAQLGQRTLLVDANLRHGVQNTLFGLPAQRGPQHESRPASSAHANKPAVQRPGLARPAFSRAGLSDMLAGRAGLDAIVVIPGFSTLSLLASGTVPPNPQELLERGSFGTLHAQLGKLYDVVLYDIAPTSHGAEALAVAAHAGGALLVAQKDQTPVAALKRLARQMAGAQVAVIGSVLVEQ
jgi:Mrp family chromosome partitioning ATPase